MDPTTHTSRHHGVLGTVVEVRVTTPDAAAATAVIGSLLREIDRLEGVFSVFDPASELRRWQRGEAEPGAELREMLDLAAGWQHHSGGAFNPAVGALMDIWNAAAGAGTEPDEALLAATVERIARPVYRVADDGVGIVGPVETLNLNAIAKGWIVDRSLALTDIPAAVDAVVINAGGDMLHRGEGPIQAGIENPHRPYDNEPPLTIVDLTDRAIATSGSSRRGWSIGDRWYGHVIDPRLGRPVEGVSSASVLAADAATADVVATILTVLSPDEAISYADRIPGLEAFLVLPDRSVLQTGGWPAGHVN